jgi:tetratricopeptide (TPR) repeat protein
MGNC